MNEELVFTSGKYDVQEVMTAEAGKDVIDWGLTAIMAPAAWTKTKGAGVKVGILDTGVDFTHPDLQQNIRAYVDFTGSPVGPQDVQGHGTHVAGIIGAIDNGLGMIGVAPEVELYCAKVLGDTGSGTIEAIIKGIQWAMAQNVDVINMSLGCGGQPPEALHQAIQQAVAQGIVVIAATGNENTQVGWPAMYDEVIAVSAMDQKFTRAGFSNFGIKNEVIAPGVDILSTYKGGTYAKLSGTSMATPIIVGSTALFVANYKNLHNGTRPSTTEAHQALDNAVMDLGNAGKDEYFGAGLINLIKLLA